MSVIGVVPFLVAVDDLRSAVSISASFAVSLFAVSAFLYPLRKMESMTKYPAAVLFSAGILRAVSVWLPQLYKSGWHPGIYIPLCALSIPGLYLGMNFKNLPGISESFRYSLFSAIAAVSIILSTGGMITVFGHDSGFVRTYLFSYPGALFIFAGIMALAVKKVIEKII